MPDDQNQVEVTYVLDDDQVLDYTQVVRRNIVRTLTSKGYVPDDNSDRNMLMNALDGLDRAAISNKRIKVESKQADNDAAAASIIAKMLNLVPSHKRNDDEVIDVKAINASVNRWKGAGALLMIIGAVFGYMGDSLIGLVSK